MAVVRVQDLRVEVAVSVGKSGPIHFNFRGEDDTHAHETVEEFAERVAYSIRRRMLAEVTP